MTFGVCHWKLVKFIILVCCPHTEIHGSRISYYRKTWTVSEIDCYLFRLTPTETHIFSLASLTKYPSTMGAQLTAGFWFGSLDAWDHNYSLPRTEALNFLFDDFYFFSPKPFIHLLTNFIRSNYWPSCLKIIKTFLFDFIFFFIFPIFTSDTEKVSEGIWLKAYESIMAMAFKHWSNQHKIWFIWQGEYISPTAFLNSSIGGAGR